MADKSRGSDKRERIIRAAVKVFAAKGFYCARVSDVAKEAGVADGTIYLYFSSKEELLRGLFEENMRRIIGQIRDLVATETVPAMRLQRLVEAYVNFAIEEPELAEVLTVELRESGKFMNQFASVLFGDFLRLITELIEDGQTKGVFRSDVSARTVSRALFGALDELSLSWVMSTSKWDLHRSGREVLDVFLGGMLSAPTGEKST
ncbi:MAG: TetR/AcrR family fatty acid metabolism transcriptional regulator [Myxococcota bacterium]|jgi:TetR/AcrR family fatty acid metabolism transcriptional regulator